jgi:putative autotransporter adhesin-like protein
MGEHPTNLVRWGGIAAVLTGLMFVVLGCATERGSGTMASVTRDVSGFNEVALNGVGNLTIRQTGSESLTIEAEDNVLPEISTEVEGNRLTIVTPEYDMPAPTQPINYELTVRDLSALELPVAANVDASDISTDSLHVTISGAGDMKIAGEADSQDIEISGAGRYQAEDLESEEAEIDISGSGEAVVRVSDHLHVEVSGSGSVEYIGNPTVSRDITGAAEVRRR